MHNTIVKSEEVIRNHIKELIKANSLYVNQDEQSKSCISFNNVVMAVCKRALDGENFTLESKRLARDGKTLEEKAMRDTMYWLQGYLFTPPIRNNAYTETVNQFMRTVGPQLVDTSED